MGDKQNGPAAPFAGDKKSPMVSPLAKFEKQFILKAVYWIPAWLETYHLTAMTILWSGCMIGFGYLARGNLTWLWGSSLMLFLQWLTDLFRWCRRQASADWPDQVELLYGSPA